MNILLISYGDLDYDGRLRSLLSLFSRIGTVYSYTRGSKALSGNGVVCDLSYGAFVRSSVEYAKRLHDIDILVLDNRKATIPGMIIKKKIKPHYTIQDSRELYLINEVKHFSGKIGCIFEKKMAKEADIVICANEERAKIMQREYKLSNLPLTYENLRQLEYSSEDNVEEIAEKFKNYINNDEVRIISSSGCSIARTNDVLVRNLKNVERKCRLFLVGSSDSKEEAIIRDLASKDKVNSVTILGQLNQAELKYLISQCHIGIVNYGQYDTNNKYCASGKLYEFVYEGIPVVTTTNPPLKRMCDQEQIGVSDDNYCDGLNKVIRDYDQYKNNVKVFAQLHTIEQNDSDICNKIQAAINSSNG
ncbi:MAG: hypothetical protein J6H21_07135 [Firmicutes bacterium]|nr:hypothetical protein [Bacillota bacterium]